MFKIIDYFDKLEDRIRAYLSHYPLWYALIGGGALVLFWRGVWHTADDINLGSLESIVLGVVVLLLTGLFSSVFIGDQIIMSGLRREKKVSDLTMREIHNENDHIHELSNEIRLLREEVRKLKNDKV